MANGFDEKTLTFENVETIWSNFSGAKTMYTPEGSRYFNITLNDDQRKQAEEAGFNVKEHPSKNEGEPPLYTLKVSFSWNDKYPQFDPKIFEVRNGKTIPITESNVATLDGARIVKADVDVRTYHWLMPNKTEGVAAKLELAYFHVLVSNLEEKYANMGDSGHMDTIEFEQIKKRQDNGLVGLD